GRRAELLARARAAARGGLAVARRFQNDLPHALREVGLLAAMQGRHRRARRCLDQSLAVSERQGARLESAQTRLMRGRLGLELNWPGAQEDLAHARQALRDMRADFLLDETTADIKPVATPSLSLVDRFDTVLDAGRRIASALSPDSIFAAVREA